MFYALKHHRAVVDFIVHLNTMEIDFMSEMEPVTRAASNSAMHLLSRRADIAIGMSVNGTASGGLKLDVLREGREFVLEIDEKGRASLVTGRGINGEDPISFAASSVNQSFLVEIGHAINDPVKTGDHNFDLVPISGAVGDKLEDGVGLYRVNTDTGQYLGIKIKNPKYGFDMICLDTSTDMPEGVKDGKKFVDDLINAGASVRLGRRFNDSDVVSLHEITQCPESIIRLAVLPCGLNLRKIKSEVIRYRSAAI